MINPAGEFAPWHGVFETLCVRDGVPLFLEAHRTELGRAMTVLGLESNFDFAQAAKELPRLSGRWRWYVTRDETRTLFQEEASWVKPEQFALSVSPVRVGSNNWDARFKTLSYLSHAQAWQIKTTPEVILLNEHGQVASAARANIFWRKGSEIFTPAHETGCRCGITREFVLEQHKVTVGHFPLSSLLDADEIFLTGSMKGVFSVQVAEGQSLREFSTADKLRARYEQEIARQCCL